MAAVLVVDVAAVSGSQHEDDELAVQHFVYDAVVANPQTPQPAQAALEKGAGQRLFAEPVDGRDYAGSRRFWDARQFFGRAALNPNRVAHA